VKINHAKTQLKQQKIMQKNDDEFPYSMEQKRIINTRKQRVQVFANAGTGKTKTIAGRIALLLQRAVEPEQIIAVSFSNQAANTLRNRLPAGVETMTVHALGKQSVDQNHLALDFSSAPTFITGKQASDILLSALKNVRASLPKTDVQARQYLKHIASSITEIKSLLNFFDLKEASNLPLRELVGRRDDYNIYAAHATILSKVLRKYRTIKKKQTLLDFGDMLRLGVKSLEYASLPYQHIFVDEFQDCSAAQVEFLRALATKIPNVMVFGDPNQAIFGFAGGGSIDLATALDDTTTFELTQSFRLSQRNANFASAVVKANGGRPIKIIGMNGLGKPPMLLEYKSSSRGELAIFNIITKLVERGVPLHEIAVLARTNAQLHDVEQSLRVKGIASTRLHHAEQLKEVYLVLRMVRRLERCTRSGEIPNIPIGVIKGISATREISETSLTNCARKFKAAASLRSFESKFIVCRRLFVTLSGGRQAITREIIADLNRWQSTCRKFANAVDFKKHIVEMDDADKIVTATIHGAKGGEWRHVVLAGATEGALPLFKAKSDLQIAEERNAMYVAITRAKERLFLINAPYVNASAKRKFRKLSHFLRPTQVIRHLVVRGAADS